MNASTLDEAIDEKTQLLSEIGEMLERYFAFEEYGRLAVEVGKDEQGGLLVKDVVVDQLVGDEAAVEKAFSSAEMHAFVPALALMSLVLGLNLLADGLREESLKD